MNHRGAEGTKTLQERFHDFVYDVRSDLRRLRWDIRYYSRVFHNRLFHKTYHVSLKEILETGRFGRIETGISIETLVDLMGEPEGGLIEFQHGHALWMYEDTEVGVSEECYCVDYFKLPCDKDFRPPFNISVNGYLPNYETTLPEFENYLQRESVQYTVLWSFLGNDRWPVVYTGSGKVSIIFGEDELKIVGIYIHADLTPFKMQCADQLALNLFDILSEYVEQHRIGKMFYGYNARLGITEEVRLSVSYNAGRRPNQRYELSVPDLGVTVVNPHTNMEELLAIIKRFFYSQTKEFWVVFPSTKELHQYTGTEPKDVRVYRGSEQIETDLFPDIEGLTLDAIFDLPEWVLKVDD